jgi:ectoine hydroxylase
MELSDDQVRQFEEQGWLLLRDQFSAAEVALLLGELRDVAAQERPENLREPQSGAIRSALSVHLHNEAYRRLSRHPRLVGPARRLLGGDVYLHQFKVNAKVAHDGEIWHWHQDFRTWHADDGMPEPRVLNAGVFLDDVTEFNGPLMFMPGSHKLGHVPADALAGKPGVATYGRLSADAAGSPYARTTIDGWAKRFGIVAPKGPAGSVLIFDGCIIHGSAPNMSAWNRTMTLATYNRTDNALARPTRPAFVSLQDYAAIEPLADDCMLELARASAAAE